MSKNRTADKPFTPQSKKLLLRLSTTLSGQVLLGLILGVATGLSLNIASPWPATTTQIIGNWLALPGYLFLAILQMIVTPLVLSAVFTGIAGSKNDTTIKKIGWRIIAYFIFTTTVAISLGLGLVKIISPGKYLPQQALMQAASPMAEPAAQTSIANWAHQITNILPHNVFDTLAQGDLLRIVIFAAIFGVAVLHLNEESKEPLVAFSRSVQNGCMVIVQWVMHLAPFAVFGLIAQVMSTTGLDILWGMSAYVGTVLAGLIGMYVIYLLIVILFSHIPLKTFLKGVKNVQMLAFSTSSSASVMPLTMQTAETNLGVSPAVARLVVPLGSTINMDGTALYQAIAAGFLAQIYGIPLGSAEFGIIILTALGASIGTPGTPGAGVVVLASILASVGIPAEGIAIILGVDRILDMCRTTLNVSGDLVASTVMHRSLGKKLHPEEPPTTA